MTFKKGKKPWNKGKKGLQVAWNKGKSPSPESIIQMVKTRRKNDSYKQSKEHKKKTSLALKGKIPKNIKLLVTSQKRFVKGQIPWNKGKTVSIEFKNKHSEFMKEYFKTHKHPKGMKGKNPWNKDLKNVQIAWNKGKRMPELSEWGRKNILRMYESDSFPKQTNTEPERKIKEELLKRGYKEGINFVHQFKFMDKFMCDFCFPKQKVIVEVYGDFWHCNPKKYSKPIHPHQIKGINRDKSKEAYIKKVDNNTWTYVVLWENDIKKDVLECIDKVEKVLKNKINNHVIV